MMKNVQTIFCAECGAVIDCESYTNADGETICESCYDERYSICESCDEVVARDDLISIDGGSQYVCSTCAGLYYYQCDDCGEYVSRFNLWSERNLIICCRCRDNYCVCEDCGDVIHCNDAHTVDEKTLCDSCFDERYSICESCNEAVARDDLISIDGGRCYVCEPCAEFYYYQCDHCGEYVSSRRLWVDRNMTICDYCADDYCLCNDCDDVIHVDHAHYIAGDYYCGDCAPSHRSTIHDYNYKPSPVFYGDLSDTVKGYYGVELEIDDGKDREEAARYIQDVGGDHIYLKHDGSLSCDGFEIVTHPATLEYHMNNMPWRDIIVAARDYSYTSHDAGTCGLHIHASRTLFGETPAEQDLNIAKIILLIDFWWEQYIVPFSRRNYNQLNDWAKKPNAYIMASDSEHDAIYKAKQSGERDRYKAVNLKNTHTVEFRFFRGTLRRDTIIASIQFIDTLIKYVSSVNLAELWDKTFNDVFGNTQHAELKDYLQKRKILDESEEI